MIKKPAPDSFHFGAKLLYNQKSQVPYCGWIVGLKMGDVMSGGTHRFWLLVAGEKHI
jgi:hypothetical protein